jgi:hypothetical protein
MLPEERCFEEGLPGETREEDCDYEVIIGAALRDGDAKRVSFIRAALTDQWGANRKHLPFISSVSEA